MPNAPPIEQKLNSIFKNKLFLCEDFNYDQSVSPLKKLKNLKKLLTNLWRLVIRSNYKLRKEIDKP